jgi:aconitate hydratase
LLKGPNVVSLPEFDPLPKQLEAPVLLKVDDNISTDEIMPAGARVLPYRSNIPKISEFVFAQVDETYHDRALAVRANGGHVIVGGHNYGQGSSREHAALAPRYLGLRVVIAKSFARIHRQNLVNFGVLPLTLVQDTDYERLGVRDNLRFEGLGNGLQPGSTVTVHNLTNSSRIETHHNLSDRQCEILAHGGVINWVKVRRWR